MADPRKPESQQDEYSYLDDLSPSPQSPEQVLGGAELAPLTETEIVSPRDPASGLPTGKRMHKPF